MTTKQEIQELIERLADKEYHPGDKRKTDPQVHPVLIGDVLERMRAENLRFSQIEDGSKRPAYLETAVLVRLWMPCGFTKSLQQIVEESGWEDHCDPDCGMCNPDAFPQLKSPSAQALFEFLLTLEL